MNPVVAKDIRKSYGKVEALRGVGFEVGRCEIFGIIGPDGAGKTTLFRILATLLLPDSGSATVEGFDTALDYKKIRRRIGYMPGRFSLYRDMTVEENLSFFAALFGTTITQNYHLIADIYRFLEPFKNRRAGNLSGGMKQKLALCCALIHKPDVLYLDEPTTGVDPVSRREFWSMLKRLQNQGITIVVSTPYMDEAMLCDRIALIKSGQLMTVETPAKIVSGFGGELWAAHAEDMYGLLKKLRQYPDIEDCYVSGESHHFTVKNGFDLDALKRFLGGEEVDIERIEPTIEDCYMKLAQQP